MATEQKLELGGLQKLHIYPKVTKIGSIIDHRIDCNG